jgi:pimeloyl-ACP methyl ester carboxylesterase
MHRGGEPFRRWLRVKTPVALAILAGGLLNAQDIAGDWQGILKFGKSEERVVVTIVKGANGGWTASEITPDDGSNPVPASSVTFDGSTLKIVFDTIRATYEGTLSASKNSFKGTLTQRSPMPFDLERATEESSWRRDRTSHSIRFVEVEDGVKLEVVDWGGTGRPLILLAGGNNHAHSFDKFAPKLTDTYRVYGISRRGSGASSVPAVTRANYEADRLGDDVLAVIAALKLEKPILVGHSLAGQELSSVGSRYPGKVAGLVYLDAGYRFAYDPSPEPTSPEPQREIKTVQDAIRAGGRKYTRIDVPILAIYALPHERGITDPAKRAEADAADLAFQGAMAKAFEKGLPSAKVVWIDHGNHYIFRSHEAEVLREMNVFSASLPPHNQGSNRRD